MQKTIKIDLTIPEECAGQRLDQALAQLLPDYSRSRLQEWIKQQQVTVNNEVVKPRVKVIGGEQIVINAILEEQTAWAGEDIPLNIVYEDESLIIVNKPAKLTVHPGAGAPGRTLVNALLHYSPDLAQLPRAGLIHRIDKDTTGLLVIARDLPAHHFLVQQLQAREIKREYVAVVQGVVISGGTIDAPIGRHSLHRTQMTVREDGRPAVTHYRVIERFRAHSFLRVELETGRTHQIRVHLAQKNFPLVGDPLYGGRLKKPKGSSAELLEQLQFFKRQALHAERLQVQHPKTGELMQFSAEIPADMQALLQAMKNDREMHRNEK